MGKALICYQILFTNSCWKCMDISLESLYLYTGAGWIYRKCKGFLSPVTKQTVRNINDVSLLIGFDCKLNYDFSARNKSAEVSVFLMCLSSATKEWHYAHCAFILYLILMITFVVFIFNFQSIDNINNSINNLLISITVYFFIRFTNNLHKFVTFFIAILIA